MQSVLESTNTILAIIGALAAMIGGFIVLVYKTSAWITKINHEVDEINNRPAQELPKSALERFEKIEDTQSMQAGQITDIKEKQAAQETELKFLEKTIDRIDKNTERIRDFLMPSARKHEKQ